MPRTRIPLVSGTDPEWTRTLETGAGQGARPGASPVRPAAPPPMRADPPPSTPQAATANPQPPSRDLQRPGPVPRTAPADEAVDRAPKVRVEVRVRPDPRQTRRIRALCGPRVPERKVLALAAKRATARLDLDPAGPPPSGETLRRDGTPSGRMVLFLPTGPVAALRGLHDPFELLQLSEIVRPQAEPLFRAELEAVLCEIEARA